MTFEDNSPRANRLFRTSAGTLKMRDFYNILHDRLEYCRCDYDDGHGAKMLSELTDIDVLCQTFCYEVEKALGVHSAEGEPAADLGDWTGGTEPIVSHRDVETGKIVTAGAQKRALNPSPRDKTLAREELARGLQEAGKRGFNATPLLIEVLIKALREGAF